MDPKKADQMRKRWKELQNTPPSKWTDAIGNEAFTIETQLKKAGVSLDPEGDSKNSRAAEIRRLFGSEKNSTTQEDMAAEMGKKKASEKAAESAKGPSSKPNPMAEPGSSKGIDMAPIFKPGASDRIKGDLGNQRDKDILEQYRNAPDEATRQRLRSEYEKKNGSFKRGVSFNPDEPEMEDSPAEEEGEYYGSVPPPKTGIRPRDMITKKRLDPYAKYKKLDQGA